ncbi:histidine phosphatase family protein [Roseateles asaccharophilus]|uniref:Broad specificity phosphatase PhoE n=1 Tax=Roseateles asaccharophilus TaxID=582607 RepID=A0ABU2A8J0_9BURK|nr:histidine phosphatase family protein [Roseateles asaccharophilus]MDR7333514.1 broad specificity phosphatase PhoE [Roseateles asaccharophilus]
MKRFSVLLTACLLTSPLVAQPDLVILVRHAERATEPAGDPGLTPAGQQRAAALAQALAGLRVNAIVTTQYRRTRDTAAPLAQASGLQPLVVDAKAGHVQAVADAVRAQTGVVLVVGHSNTVPAVLAALGGPKLVDLCETSFHHVFTLQPGPQARWAQFSYGAPSKPPEAGCL